MYSKITSLIAKWKAVAISDERKDNSAYNHKQKTTNGGYT